MKEEEVDGSQSPVPAEGSSKPEEMVMAIVRAGPPFGTGTLIEAALSALLPNPFQPRRDSRSSIRQMADSLNTHGLAQLITVRDAPGREGFYEIISGHRRVEALRLLAEEAPTEEERRRFSTVLVLLKPNVTDEQMARDALVENIHRQDLPLADQAAGLENFRVMQGLMPAALAKKLEMEVRRVRRLLQFHRAADFIKDACSTGVLVPAARPDDAEPGAPAPRERRHMDLLAALEFSRLYDYYRESASPGFARKRVEPLVKKALEEGWPFSRIEEHCHRLMGKKRRSEAAAEPAPEEVGMQFPDDAAVAAFRDGVEAALAKQFSPEELARMETGHHPSHGAVQPPALPVVGAPPPNPALEYVGGNQEEILFHLGHLQELSDEQRDQMCALFEQLAALARR